MMHVEDVAVSYRGDYYYVQDALYNVRALVSDNSYTTEEQTTYDAYGMPFNWCSGDADGDGDVDDDDQDLLAASYGSFVKENPEDYNWRCDVEY